ncbi:hypothetical protein PanWU01x14_188360 [Parasponia andersonii]|uniref:Uncharacterized protein n=1 Tax=Parasponia andersonii TaxID=3476 RepID=A0A2P5C2R0_PARAD|nr:hypothetical protein PanWU01x14_188360 [Parasponia andersonii]
MSNPNLPDHDDQQDDHDHHQEYLEKAAKPKLVLEQLLLVSADHNEDEEGEKKEKYENCRTPTSDDQKIPKIQSCPPTPRKPVPDQQVFVNKRKFSELHFFESTAREEVESFFKSIFQQLSRHKKRCKSV